MRIGILTFLACIFPTCQAAGNLQEMLDRYELKDWRKTEDPLYRFLHPKYPGESKVAESIYDFAKRIVADYNIKLRTLEEKMRWKDADLEKNKPLR